MRREFTRAVAILCQGRSRKAVIAEIAATCAATIVLWFTACAFVLLEPLQ